MISCTMDLHACDKYLLWEIMFWHWKIYRLSFQQNLLQTLFIFSDTSLQMITHDMPKSNNGFIPWQKRRSNQKVVCIVPCQNSALKPGATRKKIWKIIICDNFIQNKIKYNFFHFWQIFSLFSHRFQVKSSALYVEFFTGQRARLSKILPQN